MSIQHVDPESLPANPAFSHATITDAGARIMFVGGQNGVDKTGNVVSDRLGPQTEQALRNVLAVLDAAGATQDDVAKLTIHVVAGSDIREGFAASQKVWGRHATAITVLVVAGLANPAFLVEIDAVAALSD
ncbi:RidA family protein [Antrihabitans cavernicola]|uniref:RidA family protein n=1 Tax=Antrihabitans cavernicola TaxID=2495913 RepID=A0A5A7S2K8_9NOCA|nr:RidA family protein [Spelaeibacter cavernicola]KAA0018383.1 RidA family protein [Spelaeibacter cavernicola]